MITAILLIGCIATEPSQPVCRQLDNGLKLFVLEDHSLPLVSVQLWFGVGQSNDPAGKAGLAAIAHAVLVANVGGGEVASKPVSRTLYRESNFLHDACYYSEVGGADALGELVHAVGRQLETPVLDGDLCVAAVRRVLAERAGEATGIEWEDESRILAALFPEHPYRYPAGFVDDGVRQVTPEEIGRFLTKWFMPANATLFVMGDVSAERVIELTRALGEGERKEPPSAPTFPMAAEETVRIEPANENAAAAVMAWRTAPLGFFENATIDVLMERLCNPIDGRLYRRLMEAGCRAPTWEHYGAADAGVLILLITRKDDSDIPASWESIVATVDEEIGRAMAETATPIELNRGRAQAGRRLLDERVTFQQRMREIAEHQVVAGDFALARYAAARVASVDVGDLREAALALQERRRAICFLKSAPRSASLSDESPVDSALPAEIAETREDRVTDRIKVMFRRTPGRELAEVRTVPVGKNVTPQACRAVAARGTESWSAERLKDYLSFHGLDLAVVEEDGQCGFRSRGLVEKLDALLEIHAGLAKRLVADTVELTITADTKYEAIREAIGEAGF